MKYILSVIIILTFIVCCQRYDPYNKINMSLIKAAKERSLSAVKGALARGAEIDSRDREHMTAIHIAAKYNDVKIIKYLFKKGASLYVGGSSGTPLGIALEYNNDEAVKFLITKKTDPNYKSYPNDTTLMHQLASHGKYNYFILLHKKGGNIFIKDKRQQTPLHHSARNGHLNIIKYLIENGIPIDQKNKYGYTALHIAAINGYHHIVSYLLKEKADINSRTKNGETPLFYATANGYLTLVKLLVKKGARINISNKTNITPLMAAKKYNRFEIYTYLKGISQR